MGRITQNKSGTWTLRYTLNGQQPEETFSTRELAVDRQAEIWRAKRSGEVTFTPRSKSAVPFLDAASAWVERSPDRGETTKVVYRSTVKQLAPLDGKTLAWVAENPAAIQALITSLPTSYRKRAKVIISGTLNTAVDDGDLASHRINRRNVKVGKEVPVKQAPDFTRFPDIEDRVAKMAIELGEPYALMIWTGRLAGLRIGESLGLNASDIVTRNGRKYLAVSRQRMADGSISEATKTDASRREIPLGYRLESLLSDAQTDAAGFYFPAQWRRTVYDAWDRARDAAGLPDWFTSHDLRHLFASTLISQTRRVDLVSKYLGHCDVKLTASVYVHALASDEDEVRDLL